MLAPSAAKTSPYELSTRPEIRLVPSPESNRFKGRVAIESLQAEYDAITELSELTDGQMRLPIDLTFDGQDLYGPDGRSLTETANKGLKTAKEQAKENPNLWFEVGRRSLELEEVSEAIKMIQGSEYNTMILTTNFPWALKQAKEDVGGYNVRRRQALRRAIVKNPETGEIKMISQTLDRSDEQALEAIDQEFEFDVDPSEERLGQRQFLNLSAEEQAKIMDRSVQVYDRKLTELYGGEWYAGRRPVDYRNTFDFVRRQHDLIDTYKRLKLSDRLTPEIMYDMSATINARFKANKVARTQNHVAVEPLSSAAAKNYDHWELYREMRMHGKAARSRGETFSACGGTYKAGGFDGSTEELMGLAGFGDQAETQTQSKAWHGGKIYKNSKCVSCEKVKDEVGACRICKDCVHNPKGNLRTVKGRTKDPKRDKDRRAPAKIISFAAAKAKKEAKSL